MDGFQFAIMTRNQVHVILVQIFIAVSKIHGQYPTNRATFNSFLYPTSGYYSPYVYPYQYPYSSAPVIYPVQSAASSAPVIYPVQSAASSAPVIYPVQAASSSAPVLYPVQSTASSVSYSVQSPVSSTPPSNSKGLLTEQQYFLGPMTAAQAQYLTSHIQKLILQAKNPPTLQDQIPSTPTLNASTIQTTLAPSIAPLELNISSANGTDNPNLSNCSEADSNFTSSREEVVNLSTTPESPSSRGDIAVNYSTAEPNITSALQPFNSNDSIVKAAQVQQNPFISTSSYAIGNWLYNPSASIYGNLPWKQPFYPPGYSPWNPFVLNPAPLPVSQSNTTQRSVPTDNLHSKTPLHSDQESTSSTPTIVSSTGEGGLSDMENLPPQVKEFIDMIPDILSMPETSQLNPSNGAFIHHLGGNSGRVTPAPKFRKPKVSRQSKKKHVKQFKHYRNYIDK